MSSTNYRRHPEHPEWGIGVAIRASARPKAFFSGAGLKPIEATVETSDIDAELLAIFEGVFASVTATPPEDWSTERLSVSWRNVYVVLLDGIVMTKRRFARENPQAGRGEHCFYVGLTGHTPEERLRNHKAGHKANRYVKEFGIELVPEFYAHFNPLPYRVGMALEPALAADLRRRGYGVWQN